MAGGRLWLCVRAGKPPIEQMNLQFIKNAWNQAKREQGVRLKTFSEIKADLKRLFTRLLGRR
jgi:hypothetical protein